MGSLVVGLGYGTVQVVPLVGGAGTPWWYGWWWWSLVGGGDDWGGGEKVVRRDFDAAGELLATTVYER